MNRVPLDFVSRDMRQLRLLPVLLVLFATDLLAQGLVLDTSFRRHPPMPTQRPRPPRPMGIRLTEHRVAIKIDNQVARTEVVQVFHNPNPWVMEGVYLFPLPDGAAVSDFTMSMGGKQVKGEILSAQRAREIYRSIVHRRRDPGLLEFAGRKLLRASMFPIPARGDVKITLSFGQVLKPTGGLIELVYPMKSNNFAPGPVKISGEIEIAAESGIATIYSPSHKLDVSRRGDTRLVASFEESRSRADRDFRLLYSLGNKSIGLSQISHNPAGEDGYFLLTLAPRTETKKEDILPKDVVFVLDTSGSMGERGGIKLDQAKRALTYALGRLDARDRFNIISFSTEARSFRDGLMAATAENVKAGVAYVEGLEATGGTAIHDALTRAVNIGRADGRVPIVIFLTDGQATVGPTDTNTILKDTSGANRAGARLFVFGVGNDVNARLLTDLSDKSRGTAHFVSEKESIEVKVSTLYDQVASPILTDATLVLEGLGAYDVYPRRLGDLFKGQQVIVAGRFKNAGARAVTLKGRIGVREVSFTYETTFQDKPANEFVPRLWGVRKVGFLLDQIRHNGAKHELVEEVRRLGVRYGIVTPYTSFLVVEEGEMLRRSWRRRLGFGGGGGRPEDDEAELAALTAERTSARGAADAFDKGAEAGVGAIAGARIVKKLKDADGSGQQSGRGVKIVGGKTFRYIDGTWVDTVLDGDTEKRTIKRVKYLSEEYDALLDDTTLTRYLSVGVSLRVLHDGVVYEVISD